MTPRRGAVRRPDEDDLRWRLPASRPRTKDRPSHAEARPALVTAVDRGRFTIVADPPPADPGAASPLPPLPPGAPLMAVKARELGRRSVVVGDRVACVGAGRPDDLARIVRVAARAHTLRRSADDADPVERIMVANADQLAVVIATTTPSPQPRLTDRALVAAWDAGMQPLLIVTKADLADPSPILAAYAGLAPVIVLAGTDAPLAEVRAALAHRMTVLLGASGVGKSTLVNRLVPGADRTTGAVNDTTGRGRHTSSSAVALPLPGGGWVIDTPGVRSFGLAHVTAADLVAAFTDLAGVTANCPRGCRHTDPGCALDEAGDPARVASLRRLLGSLAEPC